MRYIAKKFWKIVDHEDDDACWLWPRNRTNNKGYGQMRFRGSMRNAHVISFTIVHGRPPVGVLLHSCDTPRCVNPRHLSEGTQTDNMQDMVEKGRHASQQKTHCPMEHEYTEANTYINPETGHRQCRKCNAIRARERRQGG